MPTKQSVSMTEAPLGSLAGTLWSMSLPATRMPHDTARDSGIDPMVLPVPLGLIMYSDSGELNERRSGHYLYGRLPVVGCTRERQGNVCHKESIHLGFTATYDKL